MKKTIIQFLCAGLVILCTVLSACGGSPASAKTSTADELDAAIRETSDYLNNQLPKGNKLVILNIQSDFPALSEYIIDELIANTVNDKVFSVVDRQQINTIRAELNFQMSGEVSDASAQSIGQMLGAQVIISGAISKVGDMYRLRVRALSVQSAEITGQFNRNLNNSLLLSALVRSQATGYGGADETTRQTAYAGSGTNSNTQPKSEWVMNLPTDVDVMIQTVVANQNSPAGFWDLPDVKGWSNRSKLGLYAMEGAEITLPDRRFRFEPQGDGWYNVRNKGYGVVDVEGGINKNGTPLQVYEKNYSNAQWFRFKEVGKGEYAIQTGIGEKWVHVSGGPNAGNGTPVVIWDSQGATNTKWRIWTVGNDNKRTLWTGQ